MAPMSEIEATRAGLTYSCGNERHGDCPGVRADMYGKAYDVCACDCHAAAVAALREEGFVDPAAFRFRFPLSECGRCWGTGRYSFNGEHSICYDCNGRRMLVDRRISDETFAAARSYLYRAGLMHASIIRHGAARWEHRLAWIGFLVDMCSDIVEAERREEAKAAKAQSVADAHARGDHDAKPRKTGCPACRVILGERKVEAQRAEVRAAYPTIGDVLFVDSLPGATDRDVALLNDLGAKAIKFGSLSPKQVALAETIRDRAAANVEREAAPKVEAPEGEVEIVGEVVRLTSRKGYAGRTELKMIVADDRGFRVYLTRPRALWDVEEGQRVRVTATLKRSDRDVDFAFASRPKGAAIL